MITVIIKRSRITHHHKFWGGLLNYDKKYYTRKMETNSRKEIQNACTHSTEVIK